MSIEKLTKRLQGSIDFALDNKEDLDSVSWNYQEGVLISANEAKLLLDLVENRSVPTDNEQSEQLVCECCGKQSDAGHQVFICEDCGTLPEVKLPLRRDNEV